MPIFSVIPAKAGIQWVLNLCLILKWIPACAQQGHSDLLSAKALAKSYAGMTNVKKYFNFLVVFFSLFLSSQLAFAELVAIPPLKSLVTDLTGTLNPSDIAQLDAKLKAFETEKGSQIAVLIVPTTQPEDIAQYSIRVADAWKLGRKKQDDGVLILVAKDDHKMRIEVGRGLEGAIPDLYAKRIITEEMSPRFKQGDFFGGINAATDKVTGLINGENLAPPTNSAGPVGDFHLGQYWPFYLIGILFLGNILTSILGRFFGSTATAGLVGVATGLLSIWPMGIFAGVAAFIATMFWFSSGGFSGNSGRSAGGGFSSGGSRWGGSSGGSSWGGGGGGDFGGGGASGGW